MRDAIKSSFLIQMAEALEPVELGAGVRILVRLLEKKSPLPEKTIHLVAGIDKDSWSGMADQVLAFFCVGPKGVSLQDAAHPIEPIASETKATPRKGRTAPLFVEPPKGAARPETLPAYLAARPTPVSIRKAIYDTGLRVLMAGGASEKNARATIAGWLKAYTESAVAEAIAAAQERSDLSDPHSWIVARLRASARGIRLHPGVSTGTPLPRAKVGDVNGMSKETFAAVMERNRKLGEMRLGASKKAPTSVSDNSGDLA